MRKPLLRRASRHRLNWSGVIGEALVSAGALYLLFVFWEQVWTTVEYSSTLQARNIEISQSWKDAEPDLLAATDAEGATPVALEPDVNGEVFARLWVPRFGDDAVPIAQGIERDPILDHIGIGHYPGTAMPGQMGNFAIAGHRTSYGKPFNKIAELEEGDPIIVETAEYWYVYSYTASAVVDPSAVETIAPVPNRPGVTPTERVITLTACHPMYSRAERWVAWGTFEYAASKSEHLPSVLIDNEAVEAL